LKIIIPCSRSSLCCSS